MNAKRLVPWIAAALALVGALVAAAPPRPVRGFDLEAFGLLPVLEGGRVKPLDSLARNSLLLVRGTQSFRFQDPSTGEKRTVGADEWLLDVLFRPELANGQPVFRIDDPEVLGLIGLPQTSNRYFSWDTLAPHLAEIQRQAEIAEPIDAKQRNRFQAAIVNLYNRVWIYYRIQNSLQVAGSPGLLVETASAGSPGASQRHSLLASLAHFRPLPPLPGRGPDAWRNVGEALRAAAAGEVDPGLAAWGRLGVSWAAQDPSSFGRAAAEIRAIADAQAAGVEAIRETRHELVFNRAQPFYVGMVIYVLALLALFASWLADPRKAARGGGWLDVLRPAAYGLLLAGLTVHSVGLLSRMFLQDRPPVTNLYSSAVFVGWGAVILGAFLEGRYRKGFGTAVAAATGFATLLVAHHLTGDGDTMEMMRAVLDSNFWLGTHVVTITIGYSGMFLAGAIAIVWVIREHVASRLDPETTKILSSMVYGVIAFALFFSFLGTVLGGIWADQSWGRFWGWDPKENGALLIVLWCAIVLHARWGGYARTRGIMAMAIFGNVITSLSWFGVNMLGVGLHSYGFMDKAFWALAGFSASQMAFIGLAYLPRQFWKPASRRGGEAAQEG